MGKVLSAKGFEKVNAINEKYNISCCEVDNMEDYAQWRDDFWTIYDCGNMISQSDGATIQRLEILMEYAHHKNIIVPEKYEPDNYDLFEDRAKSLLRRWKDFKDTHRDVANIDKKCIHGFLSEINDEFTQAMMREEDVDVV